MTIPITCQIATIVATMPDNEETWKIIQNTMESSIFGNPTEENYLAFRVAKKMNQKLLLNHLLELVNYPYISWLLELPNHTYFTHSKDRLKKINEFENAMQIGDLTKINDLINDPYLPLDPLMKNQKPLQNAIWYGHLHIVKYYMNICKFSSIKHCMLLYACEFNSLEIVKLLVENKVDAWHSLDSPMLRAAENGCIDTIQYLISMDSGDIRPHYEFVMQIAAENGHLDVVNALRPYMNCRQSRLLVSGGRLLRNRV